jgi:hypothetical protein
MALRDAFAWLHDVQDTAEHGAVVGQPSARCSALQVLHQVAAIERGMRGNLGANQLAQPAEFLIGTCTRRAP